jgi:hypothetical protein
MVHRDMMPYLYDLAEALGDASSETHTPYGSPYDIVAHALGNQEGLERVAEYIKICAHERELALQEAAKGKRFNSEERLELARQNFVNFFEVDIPARSRRTAIMSQAAAWSGLRLEHRAVIRLGILLGQDDMEIWLRVKSISSKSRVWPLQYGAQGIVADYINTLYEQQRQQLLSQEAAAAKAAGCLVTIRDVEKELSKTLLATLADMDISLLHQLTNVEPAYFGDVKYIKWPTIDKLQQLLVRHGLSLKNYPDRSVA